MRVCVCVHLCTVVSLSGDNDCGLPMLFLFMMFQNIQVMRNRQSREQSLLTIACHMMRVIQLRLIRWLGLGFAVRRHRLTCVIATAFIVILILHFLKYRDHDSVGSVFCSASYLLFKFFLS